MDTKMILVVRKDLNMRKGKIAAQCCHAAMSFLTKEMMPVWITEKGGAAYFRTDIIHDTVEITHWLANSFRKICVYVNSEQELDELHQKALDNGLISHMIEDNGATEFNGVKTKTCIAIGPHFDDKFIGITDHLPLL